MLRPRASPLARDQGFAFGQFVEKERAAMRETDLAGKGCHKLTGAKSLDDRIGIWAAGCEPVNHFACDAHFRRQPGQ